MPSSSPHRPLLLQPLESRQLLSTLIAVPVAAAPIASTPPVAATVVLHEIQGRPFTADLGSFVTIAPPTGLSAMITWGDGSASLGSFVPISPIGVDQILFAVDGAHTYNAAGDFHIDVLVTKSGPTPTSPIFIIANIMDEAVVSPANLNLTGKIAGRYTAAPTAVSVGATYLFNGTGIAGAMGPVDATGSITFPPLISAISSARASGQITLSTLSASPLPGGSVTLQLTAATAQPAANSTVPALFTFTITSATGAFAGSSGTGTLALLLSPNNTFTFLITSVLPPTPV